MEQAVGQHQQLSPLLSVSNLWWLIDQKTILDSISLDIHEGEFIGLIGPNGAGKSSLLRCLYRYIKPSRGHVLFAGKDIWQYSQQAYAKQVAVVLQESPSDFNLTVTDVVSLGLLTQTSVWHRTNDSDKQLISDALAQVGLTDKATECFEHLSGGEKQRTLIARAIVQQPKLLIMDEPTSHLDAKYQIQIIELAKSLGITVLASFHDLNLASAMCDRLLLLNNGFLVADGTPQNVITSEQLAEVFGVCTQVNRHPQHGAPHITYFYGYNFDADNLNDLEKGDGDV
ncbi:ABC transporter ATP-binding protein [Thalassotalea euphylliae]|uniref:ABC transporter ATP-binding protein n=1 Tax=Thalassotalea euphylliae TaxID=1655234 RepID=UPI003637FEA4